MPRKPVPYYIAKRNATVAAYLLGGTVYRVVNYGHPDWRASISDQMGRGLGVWSGGSGIGLQTGPYTIAGEQPRNLSEAQAVVYEHAMARMQREIDEAQAIIESRLIDQKRLHDAMNSGDWSDISTHWSET